MRHILQMALCAAIAPWGATAVAQDITEVERTQAFTSDHAIVNTAIPFAKGAREAQQNLRGAFGWANFQEGIVKDIYFRFDPDGYGRFSLSARLDTDVFEVVCRPQTYFCVARKDGMTVMLSNLGEAYLKFADVALTDAISIYDGTTNTPLNLQVMQPLPYTTELQLSGGGELVITRSGNVISKTSLIGFEAVVSYLRWVAARQNYAVLPHDWPMPESGSISAGPRTAGLPFQSPQGLTINQVRSGAQYDVVDIPSDVEQMRAEIERLRSSLAQNTSPAQVQMPLTSAPQAMQPAVGPDRLSELEMTVQILQRDLAQARAGGGAPEAPLYPTAKPTQGHWAQPISSPNMGSPMLDADTLMANQPQMAPNALPTEVSHLTYLVQEMGIAPQTALVLMQFVSPESEGVVEQGTLQRSYHDSLAESILADLEEELASTQIPNDEPQQTHSQVDNVKKDATSESDSSGIQAVLVTSEEEQNATASSLPQEYQSLSEYFLAIQEAK